MAENGNGVLTKEETDRLRAEHEADERAREAALAAYKTGGVEFPTIEQELDIPPCPDRIPAQYEMDAWLIMAKPSYENGRLQLRESMRKHVTHEDIQKLRRTGSKAMREAWSYDAFAEGFDQLGAGFGARLEGQYVPLLPGPVTRQLYWQDYFAMSAKAFEAYNHDPITWRAVQLQQEFVLGKGLQMRAKFSKGAKVGQPHDKAQEVWDEFWKRNEMEEWRLSAMVRDICVMGEQMLRYFPVQGKPSQLIIRSLDPASIYDIITDPEDFETVFAYHQQFQTPYQLYAPTLGAPNQKPSQPSPYGPTQTGQLTKYIIRQILPTEIDHYKINVGNMERRGRSDLYPSLTWINRLRQYLTSKVIRSDMLSRIVWDLAVSGNAGDIQTIRQQLFPNGQPPLPGTVLSHSDTAILTAVMPGQDPAGTSVDPTFIALANLVCLGPGVPVDYILQVMRGGTRANALVATEPIARRLEDRQSAVQNIIGGKMFDRVMKAANITDASLDVAFPPIATEDATQTLQNLSFGEANQWFSKQTAAARAAAIVGVKDYDYAAEQDLIEAEFEDPDMEDDPNAPPPMMDPITGWTPPKAQRAKKGTGKRTLIIATNRQAAKLDPTKTTVQEDDPYGVLVGLQGSVPPGGGSPGPGSPLTGQPGQPAVPNRPTPTPASQPTRTRSPASDNPASSSGSKGIAKAASREADDPLVDVLEQLAGELKRLREVRKRPDDPSFLAAAEEYRRQTAANLKAMVDDHTERVREADPVYGTTDPSPMQGAGNDIKPISVPEAGLQEAHYRPATNPHHSCATCLYMQDDGTCSKFAGSPDVDPLMMCDEWAPHDETE